jgi:hypothetical protein
MNVRDSAESLTVSHAGEIGTKIPIASHPGATPYWPSAMVTGRGLERKKPTKQAGFQQTS